MSQEHKYISALKFAFWNEKFSKEILCQTVSLSTGEFDDLVGIAWVNTGENNEDGHRLYQIIYSAAINYIDYIELKEARESSRTARTLAIVAIGISSLLAIGSIGISVYQLNQTPVVRVANEQLQFIASMFKSNEEKVEQPPQEEEETKCKQ